ncbi:MAG: hypothetical protein WC373_17425 [Smithella sp.]
MSIIESIRTYILTYTGLTSGAPVWVDYLGQNPTEYSIVPLAGARIIEKYLDGGSLREFPFAFQSMESTADNLERLESIGFYETFSEWLDTQTEAGTLPTLASGKTPTLIEALGCGYLFQESDSSRGIYQVQCRLEYEQT